jgi:hypothetical protein
MITGYARCFLQASAAPGFKTHLPHLSWTNAKLATLATIILEILFLITYHRVGKQDESVETIFGNGITTIFA